MIEFFAVGVGEDHAFLNAWSAQPRDATLVRALRDDVQPRFASLTGDVPEGGVLLIGRFTPPPEFTARQGYLGAWSDGDVAVVHWSSPLMYARTVNAHGDVTPNGALYARAAVQGRSAS